MSFMRVVVFLLSVLFLYGTFGAQWGWF